MKDIVQLFKALSDETRLKILIILSRKKICAKGIAKHLNISEAAVSQHLKILREAGLISGEKSGYFVHYDIQEQPLSQITDFISSVKNHKEFGPTNFGLYLPDECEEHCKTGKLRGLCKKLKI